MEFLDQKPAFGKIFQFRGSKKSFEKFIDVGRIFRYGKNMAQLLIAFVQVFYILYGDFVVHLRIIL